MINIIDINRSILQKIEESEADTEIKEFLKQIFLLELEHFDTSWQHGKEYTKLIKQYVTKWEVKK